MICVMYNFQVLGVCLFQSSKFWSSVNLVYNLSPEMSLNFAHWRNYSDKDSSDMTKIFVQYNFNIMDENSNILNFDDCRLFHRRK